MTPLPISINTHKHSAASEMSHSHALPFLLQSTHTGPAGPYAPSSGHTSMLLHLLSFCLEKPLLECPLASSHVFKSR